MQTMIRSRSLTGLRRACSVLLLTLLLSSSAAGSSKQDEGALFWAIYQNGETAGFLLGTIHSEDPRVLDFSEPFTGYLSSNGIFAMEMVPDLPTLQKLTEYMRYPDGTTLESRVGPERYAKLLAALADYQVPPDWIVQMKVWAAMMTLSVPPPETGFFMDFSLSLRAAGAGLKVVGLETLEQQLAFLEDMPLEQQLDLLDQALSGHEKVGELHTQMVDAYLEGDLQALSEQTQQQLAELGDEARQYFMREGIEYRNQRMISALLPLLEENDVFVAVGALHLPGKTGLVQLLRDQGYELRSLPLPLNAAGQGSAPAPAQQQKN